MKDYYKEMEEILNPMKKINDEMYRVLNPMKNIMDSIKPISMPMVDLGIKPIELPNFGHLYSSPFEWQKQMEYDLNPLKKLQEEMEYSLNPLKKMQDEMDLVLNPFKNLQSSLVPMKKVLGTLNLFNSQTSTFQINEEIQKILKGLDVSSFNIDESVEKELEEQINSLETEDKKTLNEIFEALKNMFPEIEFISQAFQKKQYVRILTYFFIFILPFIQNYYKEYKQNILSNSYYKINRDKVRVRSEPSKDDPKTIIVKLNKNVFVEKIGSYKNWIKIEFENDNGEEIEGWVRNDMVTKIEND